MTREITRHIGVRDELGLSNGACAVLRERYLRRDEQGRIIESTGEMMDRVARHVAGAEDAYRRGSSEHWSGEFARSLRNLEFLPNSPTLMNAGTGIGLLSACFVLALEDSLESIFGTLRDTAMLQQAGAGTGFSFSKLRPAGDVVATTHGVSSGPVSFLRIFDVATEVIRMSGRRRGANMAVLDVSHPDIFEFVAAKSMSGVLAQFNLSVGVTNRFISAVMADRTHRLVNPRTGRTVARVSARELFDRIAEEAWRTGEPGLLFLDRINRANPVPSMGRIEATNPCGEVPLLAGESCNLASVNLARLVTDRGIEWDRLRMVVGLAVRFLDDVIDVNDYPTPALGRAARETRKIGLGVMGLAELLATLGVPYDSEEALRIGSRIAREVRQAARAASATLAGERGPFPRFAESVFAEGVPLRNAQLTAIAPTGTISLIAATTAGIEPLFAISYVRNILGDHFVETNPRFEHIAHARGFYSEQLASSITHTGRVRGNPDVPDDVQQAFGTALEIEPAWHLRMQAAMQRYVDASVSKTVNLPADATVEAVRELFLDAWRIGAKGLTVYRYGSRANQVLSYPDRDGGMPGPVQVDLAYAGGCTGYHCDF
ncbi:MAG: adenosylcobalamin-dependent ribonucleoside-diphosphate reductase [Acidimicrobiia bacterium]